MLCLPVCMPCTVEGREGRREGRQWRGLCDKAGWGLVPDMSQEKPGHICNHPEFKRVIYSQSVVKVALLKMPVGLCWEAEQLKHIIFIFLSLPLSFSLSFSFLFPSWPSTSLAVVSLSPVWHLLTHAGEHISLLHSSALTSRRWLNFEALRRLPLSSSSSWVVYLWPRRRVTPRLQGIRGAGLRWAGRLRTFHAFLLFVWIENSWDLTHRLDP